MMQHDKPSARRAQIAGLVLMLMVAVMLAGCGKKGNPEAPAGEPNTYPQAYPKQ